MLTSSSHSPLSMFNRNALILIADSALFITLLFTLPYDESVVKGLSILIFIAILWLTEALHVSITALLVPMLAVIFNIFDTSSALSHFSNSIIFIFLGGFSLAAALHKQQIDKAIADQVLIAAKGKMFTAVMMLFTVSAMLSMWISNTATIAMMLPLVLGVMSNIDEKKHASTYVFVLLGIAYCASIGGIATLVGSPPNAIAAAELGLSFTEWVAMGLPVSLTLLPIAVIVIYIMTKPNLKHTFDIHHTPLEWTNKRKLTLIIFLITVSFWVFSKPINALLGGYAKFDTLVAIGAILMLGATRVVEWKDIEKTVDWGVLLLFGGGICLSNVLKATGTSVFLAQELSQLLNQMNMFITLLAIIAFVVFLTEFASNTASAALLIPIFASIAEVLGVSPIILSVIIAISASCAFMLPVATPPNALVFASGHIEQKEMMRVGIVLNLVCILTLSIIAHFFW
ncbi:transporter NadC family protein [Vibrio sp. MACH09]|uniref:SLC13 family permease n=1 Tax=unclassified Vibrio TaxID=2614977 RepID=UPI001493DC26|nr:MULTISPECIES: DASS family sodium-coupled anion symporter [unclassified Vibrio]NOI68102.1 DASS family sodium-coupled anion symporter [Vibrio sp. 99-8-1]GLO60822.1 transporter NadC family protein [Vibrio sp. MACH09]